MIGRRVAITGLGVVAPCGIGQENFWSGLLGQQFSGGKWTTITDWDPLPFFDSFPILAGFRMFSPHTAMPRPNAGQRDDDRLCPCRTDGRLFAISRQNEAASSSASSCTFSANYVPAYHS